MTEIKELEMLKNIGEFARKLVLYKSNLLSALSFFIFGACISAGIMIGYSAYKNFYLFFGVFISFIILSIILVVKMETMILRGIYPLMVEQKVQFNKNEGIMWILCFSIPFPIFYSIIPFLSKDTHILCVLYTTIWYLALGISLSLVGLLIFRSYVKYKICTRNFHLISGILIIITYPVILLLGIRNLVIYPGLLATGFMLLIYTFVALYAWYSAEKVFTG